MHLIMDGPCSNVSIMRNRGQMAQWLHDTAIQADMTPHGNPMIDGFAWPESSDESALSAVQFLSESAIVIHTWPEVPYAFIDVFSCRDFDVGNMERFIRNTLGMGKSATVLVLERGVDPSSGKIAETRLLEKKDVR